MGLKEMKEYWKRIPNWVAIGLTALGMIVLSSLTIGGDSRQIEINTERIEKIEDENKSDHKQMMEDINQLKIDVGIISDWVQEQRSKSK